MPYFRSIINRIVIDKLIFNYFRFFREIFHKEIFEYKIGLHFHNFVLRYIRGKPVRISDLGDRHYLIKMRNLKFIIRSPRVYYSLLRFGEYEPVITFLFKKILKKNMNILDIGGNLGYFSLLASDLIGEKGKVITFEPDPNNYALLRENLKLNNVKNVKVIQKCVSNEAGTISLYLHPKIHSCHSIFKTDSSHSIEVEAITLDQMFKSDSTNFDFIKMDIEGAEINALRGMKLFLRNNKVKYLLTEMNIRRLNSIDKSIEEYVELLVQFFGNFFVIIDDKSIHLDYFNDKEELITYIHSLNQDNLNILCVK